MVFPHLGLHHRGWRAPQWGDVPWQACCWDVAPDKPSCPGGRGQPCILTTPQVTVNSNTQLEKGLCCRLRQVPEKGELGQGHLQPRFPAPGIAAENVEDDRESVQHRHAPGGLQVLLERERGSDGACRGTSGEGRL